MNDNNNNKMNVTAEKQPDKAQRGKSIGNKRGFYTAAVSALALAIVIIFNLILAGIPSGTLEYDISDKSLYQVTQQSVDYLKTLDTDVHIVVLSQKDAIDEMLLKFINNYAKQSPHLKLEIIDPVQNPNALKTYNAQENNVVVTCPDTNRTRLLQLAGLYGYHEGLILYDPNDYQYGQLNPVAIDAEGQLTSAVSYVTSQTTHKLYLLEGHGEAALGTLAASAVTKGNIETASLNLLKEGSVPAGSELILCNNPTKDLTSDELDMLKAYLRAGGNVMLILNSPDLTNFNALLKTYGLQLQNGYVGDQTNYYSKNGYFWIFPTLASSSDITSSVSLEALVYDAFGLLAVTPDRRGAVVTPFMTTSESGFLDDGQNAVPGQYILGATATEALTDSADTESRLTVISASSLIGDDLLQYTNLSNLDIFMNALSKNFGEAQNISIPEKSLNITMNSIPNPGIWSVVIVFLIPIAILGGGLFHWSKRRRR